VDTDCNEIFKNSCNPAFISINSKLQSQGEVLTEANKKLDKLMTVVCLGNGKPALTERIAVLETVAHAPKVQQAEHEHDSSARRAPAAKSVKFGPKWCPIEVNGYNASDAAKIVLGIGMAVLMYTYWQGLKDRRQLAETAAVLVTQTQKDQAGLKKEVTALADYVLRQDPTPTPAP